MTSKIIYTLFGMLIWSDLFNYMAGGTPLVVWKQVIVAAAWIYAIRIDLQQHKFYRSIAAMFTTITLIAWSVIVCDVNVDIAMFNSFLYFSWVPMYVIFVSNTDECLTKMKRYEILALALLIASVVGLYLDWYTDYFNWIEKQVVSVDLLESIATARRASFFFISSTMVIPLVAAPAIFYYMSKPSIGRGLFISFALVLSVVPTGSGSSLVVALICCAGILVSKGKLYQALLTVVAVTLLASALSDTAIMRDNKVQLQMERMYAVFDTQTKTNVGRIDLWEVAINDISQMGPVDLLLGYGLGVTNDNKGNLTLYTHGESSYLQAMLEAGLIGIISRILPFALIFIAVIKKISRDGRMFEKDNLSIFFWAIASLFAVATAPTFGNIPFQTVIGFLLALVVRDRVDPIQRQYYRYAA